jgi:hypothetical protein
MSQCVIAVIRIGGFPSLLCVTVNRRGESGVLSWPRLISSSSWCADNCRFKIGCFTFHSCGHATCRLPIEFVSESVNSCRYECFRARKLNCCELLLTRFRLIYSHSSKFNPAMFVFFIIGVLSDYKFQLWLLKTTSQLIFVNKYRVFLLLFCRGGGFISQKACVLSQHPGTVAMLRKKILWRYS